MSLCKQKSTAVYLVLLERHLALFTNTKIENTEDFLVSSSLRKPLLLVFYIIEFYLQAKTQGSVISS